MGKGDVIEKFGTTPEHPFYVAGKGFVAAGELKPGMVIKQVSSPKQPQLMAQSRDNDTAGSLLSRWLAQVGDWISHKWGTTAAVAAPAPLAVKSLHYGKTPTTVYNFEVEDTHTYVVGKSQALVHNACGPEKPLNWSGKDPAGLSRKEHVKLHGQDNLSKPLHGVFSNNPIHTIQQAWGIAKRQNIAGTIQGSRVVYDIPFPNAGWQGGANGTGAVLNTIRIVVGKSNNLIITGFPR